MTLLSIVALMGVVVNVELMVIQRNIKRNQEFNIQTYGEDDLSEGMQLIEGADGELHLPGCKYAAPPVTIVRYRRDEMEERSFCPECTPDRQTLEK